MDSSQTIAHYVAALNFKDLPASAVEATRRNLLDTIGCAIAGASAPGCREVARMVLDDYPVPQARVWGTGRKATAAEAALANGTMAHALDFDDTHDGAIVHAGVSTVPAALAVADRLGGVTGEELMTAVAAGLEVTTRLSLACLLPPVKTGWAYTALFGLFGATVAAGKLMKLDGERLGHAMGIAYAQAAGNCQCMPDGALSKRMQPGFSARIGVMSSMLAAAGITGTTNTFDGAHGLSRVYMRDQFDSQILLRDLGGHYEHEDLAYKPYPSCRNTHSAVHVALQLAREHSIDPQQIEEITVGVNVEGYSVVCVPPEVKTKPRTVVDAQFSIPFLVATAFTKRDFFIDDLSDAAMRDPQVLRLAAKVKPRVDSELEEKYGRGVTPAAMTVVMKNGTTYSGLRVVPPGGLDDPLDFDKLAQKFRRCVTHSRGADQVEGAERLVKMFRELEGMQDVARLTDAIG